MNPEQRSRLASVLLGRVLDSARAVAGGSPDVDSEVPLSPERRSDAVSTGAMAGDEAPLFLRRRWSGPRRSGTVKNNRTLIPGVRSDGLGVGAGSSLRFSGEVDDARWRRRERNVPSGPVAAVVALRRHLLVAVAVFVSLWLVATWWVPAGASIGPVATTTSRDEPVVTVEPPGCCVGMPMPVPSPIGVSTSTTGPTVTSSPQPKAPAGAPADPTTRDGTPDRPPQAQPAKATASRSLAFTGRSTRALSMIAAVALLAGMTLIAAGRRSPRRTV
jgi:hypothetical protein